MTPEQAKTLAQPIVDIYAQLTDDLMTSIAAQLGKNNSLTDTAEWQLKKLAQLGELNDRNIRTISKRTSECPDLYYQAVVDAASQAMSDTDSLFSAALAADELQIPTEYPASVSMMNRLKIYQDQAKDILNLTNTTMAYKARDAYTGIVNKVAALANDEEYRKILGKNAASVVTGIQSRQAALRQCLNEFAEKGMPGFVDKAGREWAPESYINMNLRTTVSNVANEAQFARMDDYGNDLIEVSSHIGARPKCAPYQGRIYSRSGRSGFTEDLHGNKIAFAPWGSTSYGDPGGLLGINCGHQIYPFFPGLSRQTYTPYDKEQNDSVYKQSQKQRALERKVRESKRDCAMLDAAGDQEGFEKASVKLKQRQDALKQFAEETGRTFKPDRVQVHGFGKSLTIKTAQTVEKSPITLYNSIKAQADQIYENAKKGTRHRGTYIDALKKNDNQLNKSILSHKSQVEEHMDKIRHPEKYDTGWNEKTEIQQQGLVKKWKKDLTRNAEQEIIERRVLKDRHG